MINDPIDDALARYALRLTAPASLIVAGTLNRNYLVNTQLGPRVLRRIRDDQADHRIGLEHETIQWVADRGIPTARPILPTAAHSHDSNRLLPETCVLLTSGNADKSPGSRWALFPHVEGHVPIRGALSTAEAAALGDMHGQIHATLSSSPHSESAGLSMQWSADQSAAGLRQVEGAARAQNAGRAVLDAIALQRRLLENESIQVPQDFSHLPCQWLHGDYHSAQVLMNKEARINAVLDWELCQPSARVWELVRSVAFSGLIERPELSPYLRAYRRHVDMQLPELASGMTLWWQSRIVGIWVWWAAFVEENTRVREELVPATIETINLLATPGWREAATQYVFRAFADT